MHEFVIRFTTGPHQFPHWLSPTQPTLSIDTVHLTTTHCVRKSDQTNRSFAFGRCVAACIDLHRCPYSDIQPAQSSAFWITTVRPSDVHKMRYVNRLSVFRILWQSESARARNVALWRKTLNLYVVRMCGVRESMWMRITRRNRVKFNSQARGLCVTCRPCRPLAQHINSCIVVASHDR